MILHKKFPCKVLEIATYFCATISLKKYQRLQFYHLHVPVLDETPYIVTKCTVLRYEFLSNLDAQSDFDKKIVRKNVVK